MTTSWTGKTVNCLRAQFLDIIQCLDPQDKAEVFLKVDSKAGFKISEACCPVNPLRLPKSQTPLNLRALVREWEVNVQTIKVPKGDHPWAYVAQVVEETVASKFKCPFLPISVEDMVFGLIDISGVPIMDAVTTRIEHTVFKWRPIPPSKASNIDASLLAAAAAYVAGLFYNIDKWKYMKNAVTNPWRPLQTLWYNGYVPSFDGKLWRIHSGPTAKIVDKFTSEDLKTL